MAFSDSPAERHREVAAEFSARVHGTVDWSAPAPVDGWTAKDVVSHLVDWFTGFLSGGGVDLSSDGPPVSGDPVTAWDAHCTAVQALLDAPDADRPFAHPMAGEHPLSAAIDRFYTADVFMHTWDLARATGQDETLDPDFSGELLAGMQPIEEMLRTSGQYGPAMPVADGAPLHEQLMAFVGRDVRR